MLLRSGIFFAAAAGLVAAAGHAVTPRDFASVKGALDNVNALLLQINDQILNLNTQNIAAQGPVLIQLGQIIQPTLSGFTQEVETSGSLDVDDTNGLNTARTALSQNVNLTVSDLVSQKPLFDMAGLSGQVADTLQQVRNASASLFGNVQSKLAQTDTTTDISMLFAGSLSVFDMAIALFRGEDAAAAPITPTAQAAPAVPPTLGQGTLNADGSCNCAVTCPAGAFL